jgi:hypothetical protein
LNLGQTCGSSMHLTLSRSVRSSIKEYGRKTIVKHVKKVKGRK